MSRRPKPFLPLAVEIGADRIAGLPARLDESVIERVALGAARGRQRSAVAAVGVGAAAPAFRAAEVGQYVSVPPALGALLLPAVEIERMPTHVDEAVDRGRAAQDLAARALHAAPVQMRLRLGPIAPIVGLGVHRDRQRRRHLDEDGAVRSAILEDQHAAAAVFAQPVGEHAARRAGADDHIIIGRFRHRLSDPQAQTPNRRCAPKEGRAASVAIA